VVTVEGSKKFLKEREKEMDITVISGDEMDFTPRGRKSAISPEVVAKVKEMVQKNPKHFILFSEYEITSEIAKGTAKEIRAHKAKVSARIRAIAKALGMNVKIGWHKKTIPAALFTK
jgi:hypothetical protein